MMHPRLARHLRKLGIGAETPPDAMRWNAILDRISKTFDEEDQAQRLIDRSMAIASRELGERVDAERGLVETLEVRVGERTRALQAANDLLMHNEGELREIEKRYQYLFEANPLPMLVTVNDSLRIVSANQAALCLYGYTMDEFLAMSARELRRPEDVAAFEAHIKRRDAATELKSEWRHRRKDGTLFDVEIIAHHMRHEGRSARLLMVLDITQRKRAAMALRTSEENLQKHADRLRVAHSAAKMIVLDYDIQTDTITFSDSPDWLRGPLPSDSGRYPYFKDQVHPEDRASFLASRQRAIDTLKPQSHEYRFIRTDGRMLWLQCNVVAFAETSGKVDRLVAALSDITERKRAEAALHDSEQRLRALLDGIPDRVWLKDHEGRYIAINRAFENAFDTSAADVVGKQDREWKPDAYVGRILAEDREVIEQRKTLRYERSSRLDNSWQEVLKAPIMDASGQVTGTVGISRDISERRALEVERQERDRAQRIAFVREIHHRIKNHVQGVAGLLMGHARREPLLAPHIRHAVAQLQSVAVVHGLQGASEAAPSLLALVTAICEAQQSAGPGAVHVEVRQQLGYGVRIVEEEAVPVALILNELVLNAVKHAVRESGAVRVLVCLGHADDGVVIKINNLGHLLKSFSSQDGKIGGNGLRIVRSLLPSRGATFKIKSVEDAVCASLKLGPPVIETAGTPAIAGDLAHATPPGVAYSNVVGRTDA